jgi:glycosyltransferase involved in cell wall biosynthesis
MKVLQVGSDSIHLRHFCKAIEQYTGEFVFLSETPMEIPGASKIYVIPFRGFNLITWLFNYRQIKAMLHVEKPEIIHVHQLNRLAWMVAQAAESLSIPLVTTAWGSDVLIVPKKNAFLKKITKYILDKSRFVTADSQDMIDAMMEISAHPQRYVHLQYGIEAVLPGNKEYIIYSNRLHKPLYRIDLIIRQFAEFYPSNQSWKLVIGASGSLTDELKQLAAELLPLTAFEFIGWVDAQTNAQWYAKARMYVSMPESDGTSVSLLEAMSANCIPILSDLPVSHEWIIHMKNGVILDGYSNPFENALKIEDENCFRINQELIQNQALRTATMSKFFKIYQSTLSTKA